MGPVVVVASGIDLLDYLIMKVHVSLLLSQEKLYIFADCNDIRTRGFCGFITGVERLAYVWRNVLSFIAVCKIGSGLCGGKQSQFCLFGYSMKLRVHVIVIT